MALADFFGRGYSDGPVDLPYDERLYLTQTLLVLSSSPLSWTGDDAVHVVGYSLGGAVAAALAAWYPRLVRSATLVCPGGLIRAEHVSLRSRVVYSDALGGWWQHRYIRSRLEPGPPGAEVAMADDVDEVRYEAFDDVPLSRGALGGPVVGDAMRWQLQTNDALPHAYVSTLANAPVYAQHDGLWARLAERLAERREGGGDGLPGLRGGRVCLVLADEDPVVVMEEWLQDASEVLGEEGVDVHVVKGGHEIAITKGAAIADIAIESWEAGGKA